MVARRRPRGRPARRRRGRAGPRPRPRRRGRPAPAPRAPRRGRPAASARRSSSRRRAASSSGSSRWACGDLLDLVAQDVGLAGPLLGVAAQARQRLVERVQLAADGPDPAEVRAGEGVEDVALRGGRDEGAVLVLAVDLDQLGRRLAQRAERGHAAVDPGPGPALGGDRAGEDHLAGGVALPQPRSAPRPAPRRRRRAPCRGWPGRPAPAAAPRPPASCRRRSPR